MFIAADYPFLDVLWTMLVFFAWMIWFWLLITVFADVFRRHDISGGKKALWIVFTIVLPFVGVLIYLMANSEAMAKRNLAHAQAQKADFDQYVQSVSGGSAGEIERAKQLLDSGAIDQSEFDRLKAKALG